MFSSPCVTEGLAPFLRLSPAMNDDNMRTAHGRSVLILDAAGALGVSRRTVYYRLCTKSPSCPINITFAQESDLLSAFATTPLPTYHQIEQKWTDLDNYGQLV